MFVNVSPRPVTLSVAAVVEAVEGLALLGLGAFVAVESAVGRPADRLGAIALAIGGVLVGAGMIAIGLALWRTRRWGRSPAVLTQIFALIIAVSMLQSGQYPIGVALVAAAVVGGIALFSGPTIHALLDE